MGTSPEAIDLAEDRDRFAAILDELGIAYPAAGMASTFEEACVVADQIGFPLLVRPSYVLGGRGMGIVYDGAQLEKYMAEAAKISPDHPVYLDRFLEGAVEVDLDALCDGEAVYVGGVLEHIEMAGIHSGDSACCTPPFALSEAIVSQLRSIARQLALRLGVVGLINIQFAIKDQVIYIIEANPRASRTVPFVSKATGVPLAKCAARIMAGEKIADLGLPADDRRLEHYSVKEAVMPFGRFPGADTVLGPEMKSTGEVMGIAGNFPAAFAKTQLAISYALPEGGTVFISVCDRDKRSIVSIARDIVRLGLPRRGHGRHGPHVACGRRGLRRGEEDPRGRAQHVRHDRQRRHRAHGQHAVRPRDTRRRLRAAPGGREARRHPRDEPGGRPGHGRRHGSGPRQRPDRGGPAQDLRNRELAAEQA